MYWLLFYIFAYYSRKIQSIAFIIWQPFKRRFLHSARCRVQNQDLFSGFRSVQTSKTKFVLALCSVQNPKTDLVFALRSAQNQKTDFVFLLRSVQNLKTDFVFLLCSVHSYHSEFVFIPRKRLASNSISRFTAILHTGLSLRKPFSHPEEKKAPPTYHAGGALSWRLSSDVKIFRS